MERDKRLILSALSHGAIFFSATLVAIGIPIAILFLSKDPVVKANARESLNFHINLYIYAFIFVLLTFVLIGFPLLVVLGLVSFIMPILAIVSVVSNPDKPYSYPFIFRIIQE
ncbi:conserved membrane hypothetical protein [Planktothrix serta PCC 8927]|uniref:DUF4870 domain-containing protein n=1 Tax=Planktothrix serta PCC 8927 TaxID=671068 RepID=A0A7Z9BMM9_9CYAN|nr:DUF4870 domain-containing protein [Planktothrix serta]VXD17679.1 conserved membrane hypothetical protein [Planktothrix serta PCC 8927]